MFHNVYWTLSKCVIYKYMFLRAFMTQCNFCCCREGIFSEEEEKHFFFYFWSQHKVKDFRWRLLTSKQILLQSFYEIYLRKILLIVLLSGWRKLFVFLDSWYLSVHHTKLKWKKISNLGEIPDHVNFNIKGNYAEI